MKQLCNVLATVWFVALPICPAIARGDGGALRAQRVEGPYRIAVFTSPTPLRSGSVDVGVLVLEATTGDSIPDLEVMVGVSRPGEAAPRIHVPATVEQATNKLFLAAQFELRDSGLWEFVIDVRGPRGAAELRFNAQAAEPLPRWASMWPWIALPAVPIVLFGIRATVVRQAHTHRR
jgi:hypothetical protein